MFYHFDKIWYLLEFIYRFILFCSRFTMALRPVLQKTNSVFCYFIFCFRWIYSYLIILCSFSARVPGVSTGLILQPVVTVVLLSGKSGHSFMSLLTCTKPTTGKSVIFTYNKSNQLPNIHKLHACWRIHFCIYMYISG